MFLKPAAPINTRYDSNGLVISSDDEAHGDVGSLALHIAAENRLLNIARALLNYPSGKDQINAIDEFMNTPLHRAAGGVCSSRDIELFGLDWTDMDAGLPGITPWSTCRFAMPMIELLLKNGANATSKNADGVLPQNMPNAKENDEVYELLRSHSCVARGFKDCDAEEVDCKQKGFLSCEDMVLELEEKADMAKGKLDAEAFIRANQMKVSDEIAELSAQDGHSITITAIVDSKWGAELGIRDLSNGRLHVIKENYGKWCFENACLPEERCFEGNFVSLVWSPSDGTLEIQTGLKEDSTFPFLKYSHSAVLTSGIIGPIVLHGTRSEHFKNVTALTSIEEYIINQKLKGAIQLVAGSNDNNCRAGSVRCGGNCHGVCDLCQQPGWCMCYPRGYRGVSGVWHHGSHCLVPGGLMYVSLSTFLRHILLLSASPSTNFITLSTSMPTLLSKV